MALHTLGTTSTTILTCLPAWAANLAQADVGSIAQAISNDANFATILGGYNPGGATGILATGSTHTNTTLDTLVSTGGGALSTIMAGDLVLGTGIPVATFVQTAPGAGTSLTLSNAATASASIRVAFIRLYDAPVINLSLDTAQLVIPGGRGNLKIYPGDVVAIDNTGWPILVSAASINYGGSQWSFV